MAKLTNAEIIASLKEMTILELNDLVKAIEEEFGVTAAAPVAAGAAAPVEEEAPKAKVKTSIYESTIAYKGNSNLEDRTSIEEKAQEIIAQVKVLKKTKEEAKKL